MRHFEFKTFGSWMRGELVIRYDLTSLKRIFSFLFYAILALLLIPITFLVILGMLLVKFFVLLVSLFIWIGRGLWKFILLLGLLLGALWLWLKNIFKRKPRVPKIYEPKRERENNSWWKRLLLPLLLLLLLSGLFLFRSCDGAKEVPTVVEPEKHEIVYTRTFNDVVVARAYLDGVQDELSKNNVVLVGIKFIGMRPAKEFVSRLVGKTYEQSIELVGKEFKPWVLDNLDSSVKLSEQQTMTATLIAMRMGNKGFRNSTFLEKVNQGDLAGAADWILLQNSKTGKKTKLAEEGTQYFYMLKLLWLEKLTVEDLLDLPSHSYRNLPLGRLYDREGNPNFDEKIRGILKNCPNKTPRELLKL